MQRVAWLWRRLLPRLPRLPGLLPWLHARLPYIHHCGHCAQPLGVVQWLSVGFYVREPLRQLLWRAWRDPHQGKRMDAVITGLGEAK